MKDLSKLRWRNAPLYLAHGFTDLWPNGFVFSWRRASVLRAFGLKIGRNSWFGKRVFVLDYANLIVGENSGINHEVYFDCMQLIRIGNGCLVGFRSCFATGNHELTADFKSQRPLTEVKPITLQDFVWIGANATILPGVTVGRGSVVAAGAVVTKDVEENVLVAGVPARKIRSLAQDESSVMMKEEMLK